MIQEKPIIFSGSMVRAILADRKIQTHRVIRPQPAYVCGHDNEEVWHPNEKDFINCPYPVGTRAWVREAWSHYGNKIAAGKEYALITYKADNKNREILLEKPPNRKWWNKKKQQWMFPLFMPRWASRITLEITDVRVTSCPTCNLSKYKNLWDSINAKRGYPWESNPFVWYYSFEVIK